MRPPSCRISKTFSDLLPGENGHKITEIDFTASKLSGLLGAALGTERTGGHRFVVLDMVELFASGKLCTKAEDVIDLPALTGPVCNKREASNKVYTSKFLRWGLIKQPTASALQDQSYPTTTPQNDIKSRILCIRLL
ncbi:hypothetical protein F443_21397 [Phytophthora nicotianae P1569]|uniref:Uncharacterized protein n=1 Tax=Phytophthora nicotianae P1569 TaxID=1317065 RepID=V9DXN7_PHYNI|nr:hypothetical protein F443_21397 [Phytophthora nicotianae P1569]